MQSIHTNAGAFVGEVVGPAVGDTVGTAIGAIVGDDVVLTRSAAVEGRLIMRTKETTISASAPATDDPVSTKSYAKALALNTVDPASSKVAV